jgi:prefoldin alpha subunit
MTDQQPQNEQELQQMYMQLQYIDTQIAELDKELHAVEQKKVEFLRLSESIDQLNKVKLQTKSFSNIGLGIYSESKITNTKEFIVNVGANTFVKKPSKEVKTLLKRQAEELEKAEMQLQQNIQMLSLQAQIIQGEMQKSLGL